MSYLKNNKLDYIWSFNQIDMPITRFKLGMKECLQHDVIRPLGVIGHSGNIIRLRWSVIVRETGPYILSSPYRIEEINFDDIKLTSEIEKLSKIPIKFNQKSIPKI